MGAVAMALGLLLFGRRVLETIGKKLALTDRMPGLTRDRREGISK